MIYTFWRGTLLSKWDETHDEEGLLKIGAALLITGMKDGVDLETQKIGYKQYLDSIKKRKVEKKGIHRSDHNMGLYALMALIKLKEIDFHDDMDGIFIQ